MKRRIEVVEYDTSWPARFENEAGKVTSVLKNNLVGLHHIGGTAMPGLASKPTIDILCEVRGGTSISDHHQGMRQLGYECRGEYLEAVIPGTPGRYCFPKVVDAQHVIQFHVCHQGHFQIAELLGLRNFLRTHPSEAEEYGTYKVNLAK